MPEVNFDEFCLIRSPLFDLANLLRDDEDLIRFFENDERFAEALFISSPQLYVELQRCRGTGKILHDKRLFNSLLKYFFRMSYRCTPFGVNAAISIGKISDRHDLFIKATRDVRRSRLDMELMTEIVRKIEGTPEAKDELLYYPNNTIYFIAGKLKYVEPIADGSVIRHILNQVEMTDEIKTVLSVAEQGATATDLSRVLSSEDVSFQEAQEFVKLLIDNRLLLSELATTLTCNDYHFDLIAKLEKYPSLSKWVILLKESYRQLRLIDSSVNSIEHQLELRNLFEKSAIPFKSGRMVQVDMYRSLERNRVGSNILPGIDAAISFLAKCFPARENRNLRNFKQAFVNKYEDQEISLMEVLDPDVGLGYPVHMVPEHGMSSILDNLVFRGNGPQERDPINPYFSLLGSLYWKAVKERRSTIQLKGSDLDTVLAKKHAAIETYSLYAMISIISVENNVDHRVHYKYAFGPSAASVMARFCHLHPQLADELRQILKAEEASEPDSIFAEIVHLGQPRAGNIAARPVLRSFEIPILTNSTLDSTNILSLADLSISIVNDKIVLRSKRLNKRVIPRLSNAHNYPASATPVYYFLCDLQSEFKSMISWDWADLSSMPYLPRIEYGNVILSRQTWQFMPTIHPDLFKKDLGQLREIFNDHSVCQYVTVSEGDNELPIDINDKKSLKLLQTLIKPSRPLVLHENLYFEGGAKSLPGRFANEIVLSVQNTSLKEATGTPLRQSIAPSVTRSFHCGTEWLYLKVYCGVRSSDRIISDLLMPLSELLLSKSVIDKWFYIRYSDPDYHLRVRFHGVSDFYLVVLHHFIDLARPFVENKIIDRYSTDVYKREIERYGANCILSSEDFFFSDTVTLAQIIKILNLKEDTSLRWKIAMLDVDRILRDFGLVLAQRVDLLNTIQHSFKKEFKLTDAHSTKLLATKFRSFKAEINQILTEGHHPLDEYDKCFQERSKETFLICQEMSKNSMHDRTAYYRLIASHIHMSLNRLFPWRQREHEAVVYDLLHQHYKSMLSRAAAAAESVKCSS